MSKPPTEQTTNSNTASADAPSATDAILQNIYYDPKTGFGSIAELFRRARSHGIQLKQVKEFMNRQETRQIHKKPSRRKTEMFKIEAPRGTWQVDHTFTKDKKINNGYHAIFVAVEIGSRFAFTRACKNIRDAQVKESFRQLCREAKARGMGLNYIVTDKGSEFTSKTLAAWLAKHRITHRVLHPTYHYLANGICERFNRTLKERLNKFKTAYKTKKWIDHLPDLMENYNSSRHSHHKHEPGAIAASPPHQLIHRLQTINTNEALRGKPAFILNQIGALSSVRIRKKNDEVFAKPTNTYSKKVYTVESIEKGNTMVRVEKKSRLLRPWELGQAAEVQTNPRRREVRSADVENALAKGREKRRENASRTRHTVTAAEEGNGEFEKRRKSTRAAPDRTGSIVEVLVEGDLTQGKIRRDHEKGALVEYTLKSGKTYSQYFRNNGMKASIATSSNPPANTTMRKRNQSPETGSNLRKARKKKSELSAAMSKLVDAVNKESVLAVNSGDSFWLAKRTSKVRSAVLEDEKRSGVGVKRGDLILTIKWFEQSEGREYTLLRGTQYLKLDTVLNITGIELETTDKSKNTYSLPVSEHKRISEMMIR